MFGQFGPNFGRHSTILNPRALPLGRHIKRTPTHTPDVQSPVPPSPAVEPLVRRSASKGVPEASFSNPSHIITMFLFRVIFRMCPLRI